jgi:hypothetical protein
MEEGGMMTMMESTNIPFSGVGKADGNGDGASDGDGNGNCITNPNMVDIKQND